MGNDTICAIATGMVESAQGVIKVSGPRAVEIVGAIFQPVYPIKDLALLKGYEATYGKVVDPDGGEMIDDGIVIVFKAPHSYTGEDVVEMTLHGSPLVLSLVLKLIVQNGARLAEPGEFTRRAFSSGKMDLSQAESVADVISARSRSALRLAVTQMRGGFKKKIEALRDALIEFSSLLELELDFSEEDIEFVSRSELQINCRSILNDIKLLADSYQDSKVIKEGIPIALIGETNVGKSTLLNTFLGEERAIVSDVHGTTRDTIEERLIIGGLAFQLIDTAGIRDTDDAIEQIGIERSYNSLKRASLAFWLIDPTTTEPSRALETWHYLTSIAEGDRIIPVVNKSDLIDPTPLINVLTEYGIESVMSISAKDEKDVDKLRVLLTRHFSSYELSEGDVKVTNLRQEAALREASEHLESVLSGLEQGLTGDLVSQELRAATMSLSLVIGEVTTDDLLGHIFSHFCIGK